jgi:hypothetical protein
MKRWMRALLVVGVFVAAGVEIDRQVGIVVPDVCAKLDPNVNWYLWWWYGCGGPSSGGGDSGAG